MVKAKILDVLLWLIEQDKAVTSDHLAEHYKVTERTARRWLLALETHGFAHSEKRQDSNNRDRRWFVFSDPPQRVERALRRSIAA